MSRSPAAGSGRSSTVRRVAARDGGEPGAEVEIEVEGLAEADLAALLEEVEDVRKVHPTRVLEGIFGKRIIVIGGGAQVAQVALGAVSEADRHNLRGERISVDTIALVGESEIAAAVRAVADLPRARLLVLAGSIMGGDISVAADEIRAVGIPIISLNMVGSITEHVDLVVSRPGPGRDDGGHGDRRHGRVRPRPPARAEVLGEFRPASAKTDTLGDRRSQGFQSAGPCAGVTSLRSAKDDQTAPGVDARADRDSLSVRRFCGD